MSQKAPKVHTTKSGKPYIKVNGKKIIINVEITNKQLIKLYKLLKKTIKPKKKTKSHKKKTKSHRRRRRRRYLKGKFISTINPLDRSTVSSSNGHPSDSGDKDLINSLMNRLQDRSSQPYSQTGPGKINAPLELNAPSDQLALIPKAPPLIPEAPPLLIGPGTTIEERKRALLSSLKWNLLMASPYVNIEDVKQLLAEYGLKPSDMKQQQQILPPKRRPPPYPPHPPLGPPPGPRQPPGPRPTLKEQKEFEEINEMLNNAYAQRTFPRPGRPSKEQIELDKINKMLNDAYNQPKPLQNRLHPQPLTQNKADELFNRKIIDLDPEYSDDNEGDIDDEFERDYQKPTNIDDLMSRGTNAQGKLSKSEKKKLSEHVGTFSFPDEEEKKHNELQETNESPKHKSSKYELASSKLPSPEFPPSPTSKSDLFDILPKDILAQAKTLFPVEFSNKLRQIPVEDLIGDTEDLTTQNIMKLYDQYLNESKSNLFDVLPKDLLTQAKTIFPTEFSNKLRHIPIEDLIGDTEDLTAQNIMKLYDQYIDEKKGSGNKNGGLYNDQIDKIMCHFGDYKGTIMRDQIKKLLPYIKPQSRLAFIINTDTHDKPGMHWDAIYIDARNGPESSNSLEWFDSFGRPMPADILEDCKLIIKMLKPRTLLKIKENKVIHQKDNTSNCGQFSCKFLIDRFRGKSFADASGYDDKVKINDSTHDEKEIERLKHTAPFNYI